MTASAESGPAKVNRIAIIGTGPVSLLKACFLASANPLNQITLFDSGDQIGGAWYSDKSPKGFEIECGCHIWSYNPLAYRYIEKTLGVPLFPMKPNAVFIGKKFRVPYSIKNSVDTYRSFFKLFLSLKWGRFKEMKNHPNTNFRLIGKKNNYPKTGSPELIHVLEKKINSIPQITFLLKTKITSIKIDDNIQLNFGKELQNFDKVYMTYVSQIESIGVYGKQIDIAVRKVDYIHFLIQLNKPLKKKLSYWRFINDPVVHRITDISYQTNFNENLILVGIKGDAFRSKSEDELFVHVKNILKNYRLIDDSFQTEKIKTHIFPTHYLNPEALEKFKPLKDKIELMHTTDLMYGIHYLLAGEKTV